MGVIGEGSWKVLGMGDEVKMGVGGVRMEEYRIEFEMVDMKRGGEGGGGLGGGGGGKGGGGGGKGGGGGGKGGLSG
uniref:hypothetical protein n=1 Tax=Paenibacillus xylanexedens TaxID=528191 RepID=UPI001C9310B2